MHKSNGRILYSATDLVGFLECEHLTTLDLLDLESPLARAPEDEQVALIQQKGHEHERAYVEQLRSRTSSFVDISERRGDVWERIGFTIEAMRAGVDIIYQGALASGDLIGYPDFLRRVPESSAFGAYSYEVVDAKLSRSEKAKFIVQLAFYSQCLTEAQGAAPAMMHLVRSKNEIEAFEQEGDKSKHSLLAFYEGMSKGDVVLALKSRSSIEAIGIVEGDYEFDKPSAEVWAGYDYFHRRKVNWLVTGLDVDILSLNGGKGLTLKTIYELERISAADAIALAPTPLAAQGSSLPYVLVIDEINRGNISKIFGELITLLEPSKRAGADEALEVVLPYSKRPFSVPSNVYVIGTMNTADRSLATLDIALRRRFTFIEMAPRPEELSAITIDGIDVAEMLRTMNQRIEVLLDRDHALGHAYFLPLVDDPTLERLAEIFRNQILPLLREYFFEGWERICWVLNDHRKASDAHKFVVRPDYDMGRLLGKEVGMPSESRH
jgi:hypothetical protein